MTSKYFTLKEKFKALSVLKLGHRLKNSAVMKRGSFCKLIGQNIDLYEYFLKNFTKQQS